MTTIETADELLDRLQQRLRQDLQARRISDPVMIGIHTGGLWIAQQLHGALELNTPLGSLDISFYRDDFTRIGIHPRVRPSNLPFRVEDRHIVLVDDVLHTGRTVRAALNEIFDYGRPATVTLAVLVARDGHELPIAADAIGCRLRLGVGEHLKLRGPTPLELAIVAAP